MKKIIGLICAWSVEDWISPCLKQAEKFNKTSYGNFLMRVADS